MATHSSILAWKLYMGSTSDGGSKIPNVTEQLNPSTATTEPAL